VSITSPRGGEILVAGTTVTIAYNGTSDPCDDVVEYCDAAECYQITRRNSEAQQVEVLWEINSETRCESCTILVCS